MTDVELRLTADLSSATREVSGFRKEYAELVRAVEKPLDTHKRHHKIKGKTCV